MRRHAINKHMQATLLLIAGIIVTVNAVGMAGGFTEQDASKPEYAVSSISSLLWDTSSFQEQAWKAVKGINDQASNNGPYYYVPIKVCYRYQYHSLRNSESNKTVTAYILFTSRWNESTLEVSVFW